MKAPCTNGRAVVRLRGLAILGALCALGCGDDGHTPSDAEPWADGSVDGGGIPDGATTVDTDEDGISAESDCDDTDPDVGRDATRSCSSDCDIGRQTCADGVWSACDASTDCACDTPGTMRTIDCGRCGIASQRCGDDGTWETPSECFDEKDCFAGEIDRDTQRCGLRSRICDDTCHWRDWEVMTPPGECEPGDVERSASGCPAGEVTEQRCTESCEWESPGCVAGCLRSPMPSTSGADPVCIPAGDFILGDDRLGNTIPVRTITLSEFHVDRYPVTKARYAMCRATGACGTPIDITEYDALADVDFVMWISADDMFAFCDWDGGALITEFQWEKAARGPAPDTRLHAWGDVAGEDCRFHPWSTCPDYPFPISSFPMNVSPYGVRLMGALEERTSSRYMTSYTDIASTDPVGSTDPSAGYVLRGHRWYWPGMGGISTARTSVSGRAEDYDYPDLGFRCVY